MSGTSIRTPTRVGCSGSTNVRMLLTPSGPKNSSRFGDASLGHAVGARGARHGSRRIGRRAPRNQSRSQDRHGAAGGRGRTRAPARYHCLVADGRSARAEGSRPSMPEGLPWASKSRRSLSSQMIRVASMIRVAVSCARANTRSCAGLCQYLVGSRPVMGLSIPVPNAVEC
jgi:hypothetical protein